MTEIERLEVRYRRLLRFDRGLWVVYAVTALIPGYFLFAASHARVFHAFGVVAIAAIAWVGWIVDTRLLDGRLKKESAAYGVTAAFILSRVGVACVGFYFVRSQFAGIDGSPMPSSTYWSGLLELLVAPPVTYLLFFAGFYRFIYHVSVHFLLRIQKLKREPNQALQTTPVTRSAYEKTIEFGRPKRGV